MGKNSGTRKKVPLVEADLIFPPHPALLTLPTPEVIDTHTHILSTYQSYLKAFPPPNEHANTIKDFVRNIVVKQGVSKVVDVWCEAPVTHGLADIVSSLGELEDEDERFAYHFVVGVHPHEAKNYDEVTAKKVEELHRHPRCVGWGEMGLDYHYDLSDRQVQQQVLRKQLRTAVGSGLNKALTIHTREADDDILTILTEELPKQQKIHIHCFTDTPCLASSLLSHFPNLYIGITGVATYSSNLHTSAVIRSLGALSSPTHPAPLRLLLETDGPYMCPAALQKGKKLPLCHSGMLPHTAEFVAKVLNEDKGDGEERWSTEAVLNASRENARCVYGI